MQIPRATYRLQFNGHFRLRDALGLVPYLKDLGISHVYSSPLFKATPGSTHGYDVCDFNEINPELGTEADLERLADALHLQQMGVVLDIVPNHMGVASPENAWWWDVLERGEQSPFAMHFDIDWKPVEKELRGKVLVPVLGGEYEDILRRGELRVLREKEGFVLGYHEHRFPLAPSTTAHLPMDDRSLKAFNSNFQGLDELLRAQHYVLVFHKHGDQRINYRRFFAISNLAAVRVENEETFEATHALVRRWVEAGLLDGLRVDHPDGLRDPAGYLQRLRRLAPNVWIVVEKILEPEETLPETWPVQGTTGYDFLNQANGLFIDSDAESKFTEIYTAFAGNAGNYATALLDGKRKVLGTLLVSEWNRLTGLLAALASRSAELKKYGVHEFREALGEVIARFPVYRSYIMAGKAPSTEDIASVKAAVHLACEHRKDLPPEAFAFIQAALLKPLRSDAAKNFAARFQQLTGAVMAKGAEDTAFYCYNRFVSQNEVGGNPGDFGVSAEKFHEFLRRQQKVWPSTQSGSSTHDTKRAEDVRARLNVLSEIPEEWAETVRRWSAMNEHYRDESEDGFPDRNTEYLLYQTLVGAWPLSEARAQAYMEKATHEAKEHTDWTQRNLPFEDALRKFISAIFRDQEFIRDLARFVNRIVEPAMVNSLSQTLVKLTAPGVPDIYQGCELWDLSLVDPDNRRPVDFTVRKKLLKDAEAASAGEAWKRREDGFAKLWLIHKVLKLRERIEDFTGLAYKPVHASGPKAEHLAAFLRGGLLATVVPRFLLKLNGDWQDTALELPQGEWQDELGGARFSNIIQLNELFQNFPVALLVKK